MGEIRTERLLLRPLRTGDAEGIFVAFNNWEVVSWLAAPPWPYTIEDTREFVAKRITFRSEPTEALHVIQLANAVIGGIECTPRSRLRPGAIPVLGYWLAEPFWGRGYMTEAARAFVESLFASGVGDRIRSGAFAGNPASLRVQEKLGFVRVGESSLFCTPRGAEFTHIDMLLTRGRFLARTP
jgi:RimJ/RimL family protein N-acetyltransferase